MKYLGLLRHAKSDWDDVSQRDFDRGLNDRGRRGARLIGDHIRGYGATWDLIVASPAARVRQTLAASGLTDDGDIPVHWDQRAYLASSATLMEVLRGTDGDPQRILHASHNPGLQELVFDLVSEDAEDALFDQIAIKLPTASFVMLELDIDRWRDLADGCAAIRHLARPRDLDPDLGPEPG